jgi:hypothetical protein
MQNMSSSSTPDRLSITKYSQEPIQSTASPVALSKGATSWPQLKQPASDASQQEPTEAAILLNQRSLAESFRLVKRPVASLPLERKVSLEQTPAELEQKVVKGGGPQLEQRPVEPSLPLEQKVVKGGGPQLEQRPAEPSLQLEQKVLKERGPQLKQRPVVPSLPLKRKVLVERGLPLEQRPAEPSLQLEKVLKGGGSHLEQRVVEPSLPLEQKVVRGGGPQLVQRPVELTLPSKQGLVQHVLPLIDRKGGERKVKSENSLKQRLAQLEPVHRQEQQNMEAEVLLDERQLKARLPLEKNKLGPAHNENTMHHGDTGHQVDTVHHMAVLHREDTGHQVDTVHSVAIGYQMDTGHRLDTGNHVDTAYQMDTGHVVDTRNSVEERRGKKMAVIDLDDIAAAEERRTTSQATPKGNLYTDKKENQIFHMYREIQNGAVAKSYMTNGLLLIY